VYAVIPPSRRFTRHVAVGASILLLHVAGLWALQAGLLRGVPELVVPVRIVTQLVTPPLPRIEPVAPAPRQEPRPEPVARPAPKQVERARAPAPRPAAAPEPLAVPDAPPAPNAPTGSLASQPPLPAVRAPVTAAPGRPAAPPAAPAKVELPSSAASYLQNPLPVYPALSKRMGEQGKVLVRVLIGADGTPRQAELKRGSGFERLDRAALEYVMKCRYIPGKVGGVPQAMWYEAPVSFVLE
jgi:protein TonB